MEYTTTGKLFIEVNGNNKSETDNNLTIMQTKNTNDEIVYEISQKLGKSKRLLMWKMKNEADD